MEERETSEFNGSQLKMFRINGILEGIIQCRHNLDIQQWLFWLQDFDMELETSKKDEEIPELEKELNKLSEQVNKHLSSKSNPHIYNKGIPAEVITGLNTFHKKLLYVFKKSGLEMKLSGDAMSGMGKRG